MPFRDVIGQAQLVTRLTRAVARDTLPPSLILAGPEGVGKRRVALALAQALNCRTPVRAGAEGALAGPPLEHDACGRCDACRRIERLVHADVLWLAPGSSGIITVTPPIFPEDREEKGVETVRVATERAGSRPFEGRRRVFVFDPADRLGVAAQNALLKILEEPPGASVFILITARPDALLPTVRSRCPRLRFGRLPARQIAEALVVRHRYTERDAQVAAAAAEGSLGDALRVQSDELRAAREAACRVLESAAHDRDPRQRLERAKDLVPRRAGASAAADREETALRLRVLVSLLRDLQVLSTRADDSLLSHTDLRADLEPLIRFYDGIRVVRAFSAVARALGALERNASPKIVADWLVFQL